MACPARRGQWDRLEGRQGHRVRRVRRVRKDSRGRRADIGPKGHKGDKGDAGATFTILGTVATEADLALLPGPHELGDAYIVQSFDPDHLFVYDGTTPWLDVGQFQGADGAPGAPGPGVAAGGAPNQVLRKFTGADYDTQWHTLAKTDVGLGNVDNTTDANKPISTATAAALALKAPTSRLINTTGLATGGGDLTADRTISVTNLFVATRAELKALNPTVSSRASLGEAGRSGSFRAVLSSTLTAAQVAAVTADTAEGIYVTSSSYALYTWIREEFTGENFQVGWFHNWATADLQAAFAVAVAVMQALETRAEAFTNSIVTRTIRFPAGDWTLSGQTIIEQGGVHITADGTCCLTCTGANAAILFRHPLYLDGQLLAHIKVTDITFFRAAAVDGTDVYLRFYICRHVIVTRCEFRNGTFHVQFDAAYEPCFVFANTFWHGDALKTNAFSLRIKNLEVNSGAAGAIVDADDGKTYLVSSQTWVFGNEMRAQATIDVQSHIYVEDIDGLQCFQNHIFNGEHQVEFRTVIRGLGRIANTFIDHNFFDGGDDTVHSIYVSSTAGTRPLTTRLYIRSNKFNDASTTHIDADAVMDELHIIDNEFDLAKGTAMIRTEGGIAICRIENNVFRLQDTASPSLECVRIAMTSLQQFKVTQIKNNFFSDDGSAATYPSRAIFLIGNPTNTCKILIDDNVYKSLASGGFGALTTDSAGANATVVTGTNTSY